MIFFLIDTCSVAVFRRIGKQLALEVRFSREEATLVLGLTHSIGTDDAGVAVSELTCTRRVPCG